MVLSQALRTACRVSCCCTAISLLDHAGLILCAILPAFVQALSKLEHIANSEGVLPGIADDQEEARSCVICMSAPRSVRFLQMLRIEGRMWELSASTIACAAVKTHIQLQEHA
mmetsp:Transcript_18336/g.32089  ORF Transcript_18336/g.32089 Transcript_18336/m.32089 type:complete len:113 (+) Transcript_18336:1-339(+)